MLNIAVAAGKGGVGKTTLALNLASAFAQEGKRVCVVDRDAMGGVMTFGRIAQTSDITLPFTPSTARSTGFDVYLYDYGPGLERQYNADLIVLPTLLDPPSFVVHKRGLDHFQRMGIPLVQVGMAYRKDRAVQLQLAIGDFAGHPLVGNRALYGNLYGKGLTVHTASGIPRLASAVEEIDAVHRLIKQALGVK